MPELPRFERKTQNRVIDLFTDKARPDSLGYVIVHEMLHLLEPTHSEHFMGIFGKP